MEAATQALPSLEERFLRGLEGLDRGELAVLRRNAGLSLGQSRGALGLFYRLMPAHIGYREEIYFLVATLFPWNDKPALENHLGHSMALVKSKGGSDSLDRRVTILLDADFEWLGEHRLRPGELGFRLRQAVKLAASKEVGVHWPTLLKDLLRWSHPDKWVQKNWARAYFGTATGED